MTNERARNIHLDWLSKQVADTTHHRQLLEMLHEHEFVWLIANDDNRVQDAIDIRHEFCDEKQLDPSQLIIYVSVLEVLVALSRRLEFQDGMASHLWAAKMLDNLGLYKFTNPLTLHKRDQIETTVDDFVWRRYLHDGRGGVFPLSNPHEDQTKVELWYQMSAYLEEAEHRKGV